MIQIYQKMMLEKLKKILQNLQIKKIEMTNKDKIIIIISMKIKNHNMANRDFNLNCKELVNHQIF